MNVDEARQHLSCRRPCGKDDDLPEMQQALAKIEGLPDYQREAQDDREMDQWIARKLQAVDPPAALRDRLLSKSAPRPPIPFYRHPFIWGVGAAAAAIIALLIWSQSSNELPDDLTPGLAFTGDPSVQPVNSRIDFREDSLGVLSSIERGEQKLDQRTETIPVALSYLQSKSPDLNVPVPSGLAALKDAIGCKVFEWKKHRVTLICMKAGSGTVHLFTIDAGAVPCKIDKSPEHCCCKLDQCPKPWDTLMWKSANKLQMLVSNDVPREELQRLVASN